MRKLIAVVILFSAGIIESASYNFGRDQQLYPVDMNGWTTVANASYLLDAADEKMGYTVKLATGTYRYFEIMTGVINTGATIDWRLETVSPRFQSVSITTGNPTGTLLCANSSGTITINSADDNKWLRTNAMTADCTMAFSTAAALVFYQGSGFDGNILDYSASGYISQTYTTTYSSNSTSGWVKTAGAPRMAALDNNSNYVRMLGVYPATATANTTFGSGSNPSYRGSQIYIPTGLNFNATGIIFGGSSLLESQAYLYNQTGVALATASLNATISGTTGKLMAYFDDGSISLTGGNTYYLMLHPLTTSNDTLLSITANSKIIADTYLSPYSKFATATSPGTWSVDTASYMFIALLYDMLTISSGQGAFPYVQ